MTVLDRAHFDRMTGGDRALQSEVAGLFQGQVLDWRVACRGTDWRITVHTIKGAARGIGLAELAAACEAAETASEEATAEALGAVGAALDRALLALERLAAEPA